MRISKEELQKMVEEEMLEAKKKRAGEEDVGGKIHELLFGWNLAQEYGVEFDGAAGTPFATARSIDELINSLAGVDKLSNEKYNDQAERAIASVKEYKNWIASNKPALGGVKRVSWASTAGRLENALAVGGITIPEEVKGQKNPTDVLAEYGDGNFIGISLKSAAQLKGNLPHANPGIGAFPAVLDQRDKYYKKYLQLLKEYAPYFYDTEKWPKGSEAYKALQAQSADKRKAQMAQWFNSRGSGGSRKIAMEPYATRLGKKWELIDGITWVEKFKNDLYELRNEALKAMALALSKTQFVGKTNAELKNILMHNWLKYYAQNVPEYVVVTGRGKGGKYGATVKHPKTDPVSTALSTGEIEWTDEPGGYTESPGVILFWAKQADGSSNKLFNIRFKYESKPFASSTKLSVEGVSGGKHKEKNEQKHLTNTPIAAKMLQEMIDDLLSKQ